MKSLLTFSLSLMTFNAFSQNTNDVKDWGLKGNVKSVTETTYDAEEKFGEVVKKKKETKETTLFDKNGMISQLAIDDYEYDSKSKLSYKYQNEKLTEISGTDEGEKITKQFAYDTQGCQIEENIFAGKKLSQKIKRKCNESNSPIEEINYEANGKQASRVTRKFDDLGKMTLAESFDENDKRTELSIYEYDEKGNRISMLNRKYKNGKLIEEYNYIYKYNNAGQKIAEDYSKNKIKMKTSVFEYDDQGNQISEKDTYGYEYKYLYKYDDQGNWVSRSYTYDMNGSKFYGIIERTVSYY